MFRLFKKYRMFLNNLRHKVEITKGNNAYLINAVADVSLLEKLIKECNRDPTLRVKIMLVDGTELNISTTVKKEKTGVDWELT